MVPILDVGNRPQALLSLYHSWPRYFSTGDRKGLLDQLSSVLSTALASGSHVSPLIPFAIRAQYREYLADGGLKLLYQPIIDLPIGGLREVEALARLQSKEGLCVTPGDFLPAFGEHELRQLFALGLKQALMDLYVWERHGLITSVAVNLPPQALVDPQYLMIARRILAEAHTNPARVTLEVLETAEIDNRQGRESMWAEWRSLGVRLAQDDLGSGYSSLLRMEKLAVDDVKIDQGLVSAAAQAPRKALQFIHHLTRLVHDLGIQVTVEGLESNGLVEAAAILGADAGQGYAIARPMTADKLLDWKRDFRLSIDRAKPQTALGAYATMILKDALVAMTEGRPALFDSVVAEPCGVSYFLSMKGLNDAPIGKAHNQLHQSDGHGYKTIQYRQARHTLEALLSAEIRAEEGHSSPLCVSLGNGIHWPLWSSAHHN